MLKFDGEVPRFDHSIFFPSSSVSYSSPTKSYFVFFASFDCMEKDFQVSDKMRSGREGVRESRVYTALVLSWRMAWQRQCWRGCVYLDQPFIGETSSLAPTHCRLSLQCPGTWHIAFCYAISLHYYISSSKFYFHFHISTCLLCSSRRHFMCWLKNDILLWCILRRLFFFISYI